MNGARPGALWEIRRLAAVDAAIYRELRLDGLLAHPEAFGASWEEEAIQPLSWFEHRIVQDVIFGGGSPGASAISGILGLHVPVAAKLRHRGVLWGMFVRPDARGAGLAASLVERLVDHAGHSVEEVSLSVAAANAPAIRLYERAGFRRYGLEPRALKVAGEYHDEILMTSGPLRQGGPASP